MALQKDLREFIELLNSLNVRYVIVGGHALAYHGYPRFTGDIDFFVDSAPSNARALETAMRRFGFGSTGLSASDFEVPGQIVQLGYPPHRIDILTSISGVSFLDAWKTSIQSDLDSVPVRFISRELLLENKRATGRPKDLADIDELTRK